MMGKYIFMLLNQAPDQILVSTIEEWQLWIGV
jgi:hypothetical protein